MRQDARETLEFMKRMQQLMAHMQDRLLPEKTTTGLAADRAPSAEPIEMHVHESGSEKGTSPIEQRPRQKPASPRTKRRDPVASKHSESPKKRSETPSLWHRDLRDILSFRRK
jgi:hypothetical protein